MFEQHVVFQATVVPLDLALGHRMIRLRASAGHAVLLEPYTEHGRQARWSAVAQQTRALLDSGAVAAGGGQFQLPKVPTQRMGMRLLEY